MTLIKMKIRYPIDTCLFVVFVYGGASWGGHHPSTYACLHVAPYYL